MVELNHIIYKQKKNIFALAIVAALFVSVFTAIPANFAADTVTGVNGQTLTASKAGDTSDWIEIARSGEYSLILRKENLPCSQIPLQTIMFHTKVQRHALL